MQIKKLAFKSVTRAIACATMLSYFLAAPARAEEVKAGDLVISKNPAIGILRRHERLQEIFAFNPAGSPARRVSRWPVVRSRYRCRPPA